MNGCKFGSNDEPFGSGMDVVAVVVVANEFVKNGAIILNGNVGMAVILDMTGGDVDNIGPGGGHAYPPTIDGAPTIDDDMSF
jgi:hypothetical protein